MLDVSTTIHVWPYIYHIVTIWLTSWLLQQQASLWSHIAMRVCPLLSTYKGWRRARNTEFLYQINCLDSSMKSWKALFVIQLYHYSQQMQKQYMFIFFNCYGKVIERHNLSMREVWCHHWPSLILASASCCSFGYEEFLYET